MILIVLCSLVGIFVFYFLERFCEGKDTSWLKLFGIVLAGALFGFLAGALLAIIVGAVCPTEDVQTDSHRLLSFNDDTALQGHFVLGTGTIRNVNYYFFYYQDTAGGIRQGRVPVDKAVIFEEDRNDGFLEVYGWQPRGGWRYWAIRFPSDRHCRILVPRGTVIRRFTADLE